MNKYFWCIMLLAGCISQPLRAQRFNEKTPEAIRWADSVFDRLNNEQKVAQLMIIRAHSNLGADHVANVENLIRRYNIGGLCFFQGGPVRQASLTNYYQQLAPTPLMIAIDGEWGLGMRLDSVINFPRQLMLGAMQNAGLAYEYGKAIGLQCKRMGIHVNYAPDVDVNNNPLNPVINDRSFGEDKYKVSLMGIAFMRGLQNQGVMACAKHFPGHGDVTADSHYDLPVVNKTRAALDSLEIYPFIQMFRAGVGSVMIAHLFIPSIDTLSTQPTSLSVKAVTGLLRNELNYQGISFTDGLEMQGIRKHYQDREANVQALIAGNDMLCLPSDVESSIAAVLKAIEDGRFTMSALDEKVKKVLIAKYHLGLHNAPVIDLTNLSQDLNAHTLPLRRRISTQSLTMVNLENRELLPARAEQKILYLGLGLTEKDELGAGLTQELGATSRLIPYTDANALKQLMPSIKQYDLVVLAIQQYSRRPAGNYGLPAAILKILEELQERNNILFVALGNPYALGFVPEARNVMAGYESDSLTARAALEVIMGHRAATGRLPVTVSNRFAFGAGADYRPSMPVVSPREAGFRVRKLRQVNAIMKEAIAGKATPGAVILAAHKGKIGFLKAFGHQQYNGEIPITTESVYDLASVTKTTATTVAVMKLYEEGKLMLDVPAANYLPWLKNTNKSNITVRQLLLHQGGLVSFIPFYRETIDTSTGRWKPGYYEPGYSPAYPVPVAGNMYMRAEIGDTIRAQIIASRVQAADTRYVYSDNDYILLGNIVEVLSGQTLDKYCREQFFEPLQMSSTGFLPAENLPLSRIVPTEQEKSFRNQLIHGYVHDPGAAMMGGVAGHAGLFSSAADLAVLYQMLLNGGSWAGYQYLKPETISLFTSYQSGISRRGLGFDKPEKDNARRAEPYPAAGLSPSTFGHTGFTGTCVWADPEKEMLYIFLSNRVYPDNSNQLGKLNIRPRIHQALYQALQTHSPAKKARP